MTTPVLSQNQRQNLSNILSDSTLSIAARATTYYQTLAAYGYSYIAISYSTDASNTWSQRQLNYNGDNALVGSVTVNKDRTTDYLQIDLTGGTFSYTNDANGKTIPDSVSTNMTYAGYAEAITNALASQVIGKMLLKKDLASLIIALALGSAVVKSTFDSAAVTRGGFATIFSNSVFNTPVASAARSLMPTLAYAMAADMRLSD